MVTSKLDMILYKLDNEKSNNNNTFSFMILENDSLTSDEINKLQNLNYTVNETDRINGYVYYTITW